jgi:predicted ABC-type ATPase
MPDCKQTTPPAWFSESCQYFLKSINNFDRAQRISNRFSIVYDNSEPTLRMVAECGSGQQLIVSEPETWNQIVGT